MSKTRQWIALAAAVVLAVLGLGWFLLVSPMRSEAAELTSQTEQQQLQTATLTRQLQVLRGQAAELPAQQSRLAELEKELPETVALPELIRLLTAAGAETGVEIVSMAPSAPVASGAISEVPFTLVVNGGYFNLEQFLGALEDLPRAFLVAGFSLAPEAQDSSELQMTLNGKVFTKAVPVDAASPAAAGAAAAPTTDTATDTAPETAADADVVQSAVSTS
ncbi:MAG: type 4a pilus biogenesis protein PilO [Actinomycetota bacterium]|nr:type 4a pilus biogenesis protein PilO [Actinomycetota bacterium]